MKTLTIYRTVIAALALALVFSLYKCDSKNREISQLQLDKQTTDSIVNQYGQTILIQEAIVTDDKQAIKHLTDSIFNLKKSQDRKIRDAVAYYKSINTATIREVKVPYLDVPRMTEFSDSLKTACADVIASYEANTITVPRSGRDSTKNYDITLTATKDNFIVNNISIPDSQYIRFVTTKGGLLKRDLTGKLKFWLKPTIQAQVLHTNDSIRVTGQNSAIYVAPKKPRILEKALLIGTGVFIGTKLTQ